MSRERLTKGTSTLDSQAVEAVVRFVRVLARCGCTPKDIAQEVLRAGREIPRSWARFSMNRRFPVGDRAAFDKRLRRHGMRLLEEIDADMHRRERRRKKGERTVPLGVAICQFEEQPLRGHSRRRRSKRSGK